MTIYTLYTKKQLEEIRQNAVPNWNAHGTEKCRLTRGDYFRSLVKKYKLTELLIDEFKKFEEGWLTAEGLTSVQDLSSLFGVGTTTISRYLLENIPRNILEKRRYARNKALTAAAGREGGCVERWKPLATLRKSG